MIGASGGVAAAAINERDASADHEILCGAGDEVSPGTGERGVAAC